MAPLMLTSSNASILISYFVFAGALAIILPAAFWPERQPRCTPPNRRVRGDPVAAGSTHTAVFGINMVIGIASC